MFEMHDIDSWSIERGQIRYFFWMVGSLIILLTIYNLLFNYSS